MTLLKFVIAFFVLLKTSVGFSQSLQRLDTIKMISREWKFKEVYSDNLNDKEAKDFMAGITFSFKQDMSGVHKDNEYKEDFKWNYESSKKELIIELKDGKVSFTIITLSTSIMKFKGINSETNILFKGTLIPAD